MLQPNRTNPRSRSEPARPLGSRLAGTGETVPRGASIRLVLVVFGCAALVRASVLFGIQRSGLNSELIGDAALFDRWARSIAEGDWIGEGVFYQAPLYPYFMGIIYTVFGADALGVRIVQCLLGALSAVFVAVAAARMFSRRVAWVAGISLALYAPAIWMDGAIQKASVGLLLSSAILFLAVPREDRIRWSRGVALGFLIGLLILTRENAALLLPILLSWVWCGWGRQCVSRRKTVLACVLLGTAAPLAVVSVRNYVAGGEALPTSSNAGVNFYIGNHQGADGLYTPLIPGRAHPDFERLDATRLAEVSAGHPLTPSEVSRYWFTRGMEDIRAEPVRWVGLLARKGMLTWNRREVMDAISIEASREESVVLDAVARFAHFGVFGPLALAGLWFVRKQWKGIWLLHAGAVTIAVSIVVFFVTARFRLGLVPFLIPLSAAGVVGITDALRARRTREVGIGVAAALGGGLIAFWPTASWPFHLSGDSRIITYCNLASTHLERGNPEDALRWSKRAVARDPNDAVARYSLGRVFMERGQLERAEAELVLAGELDARCRPDVEGELGMIDAIQGHPEKAVEHFRSSIRLDPRNPVTHFNLGLAWSRTGRSEEGAAEYLRATALDPNYVSALRNLAYLHEMRGSLDETAKLHRRILSIDPRFEPSLRWLEAYRGKGPKEGN